MNRIDDKKFIQAWMESETYSDVAKKMNMPSGSINAKSMNLRKRGVKLPKLMKPKKKSLYTVTELNDLVASYSKPTISQRHKNSLFNRKKIKV